MKLRDKVLHSILKAHPYEEPAYDIFLARSENKRFRTWTDWKIGRTSHAWTIC